MPGMNRSTIINSALRRLGGVDTNIPTGGTNPANSQAEAAYTSVVRRVLSAYDWGFATRYRELAEVAEPPLFGFTKAYQLPSDTVRLVSVHAGMRDDGGGIHMSGSITRSLRMCGQGALYTAPFPGSSLRWSRPGMRKTRTSPFLTPAPMLWP